MVTLLRRYMLAIGLLPLALAAPSNAVEEGAMRPVLEVQEKSQDGGVVEEGTVVKYRFVIVNRGQADLQVPQVKTSCGCSVARWEKVIKPGQEGAIEAEMHTEFFRGPVSKYLTVFSNDPERPQVQLGITARVTPLVEIKPATVAMVSVDDQPVTHEFTIERNGSQPMQILQVTNTASYLKSEVTPLPGEGRYRLKVTVSPEVPMGRTVLPIVVKTDLQKAPNRTLTLMLDRGIVTTPPMVFWGILPPELKSPMQGAITLTRRSGSFHVTGVAVDDEKLQAKLETVRDGSEYRITVTYAGGWDTGLVKKTLTVTTDDPKQPVIDIPVQAVIQQSGQQPINRVTGGVPF
jgi:hypothetical protein